MKGKMFFVVSLFILLALVLVNVIFANPAVSMQAPAIQNLTNYSVAWAFINVSSNETINATTAFSWWNETGANINFTANDSAAFITIMNTSLANYTYKNFTNLRDGEHKFQISVFSNESLSTTNISINVSIDTTNPTVTAVPFNGTSPLTTQDPTLEINVTAGDNNFRPNNITIRVFIDRAVVLTTTILNNTKTLFTLSTIPNGNHTMQVEAADRVGNRANSSITIINIDSVAAAILIPTPNLTTNASQWIFPGNMSKTYTLGITFNVSESTIMTNVTFFMPYGFFPSAGRTVCNGGGSLRTANIYNSTHVSCAVFLGNVTVGNGTAANLTVYANYSAMPRYGMPYSFAVNVGCGNVAGCPTANLNWTMNATPYAVNPRPEAVIVGNNVTLLITNWNQTDPGLRMSTPIYTFNSTLGRPQLANTSFGEIMYFDKSMFEMPSFMRLWSFNLTFRVIYDGAANGTNFTIRSPINASTTDMGLQAFMPLLIYTNNQTDFHTNTSVIMTMGTPNPNAFTIYWNGTNYSSSAFLQTTGINLTYGFGNPQGGTDQAASLLTLLVPNDTIAERINNTDFSVLFTLSNSSAGGSSTSPVFVNWQRISGWSTDEPPRFGGAVNNSYLINITNPLLNYTLSNLSISIMQPMNVTINSSGTITQFNMTRNIHISVWNGSEFIENASVIRSNSNMTFVEAIGPAGNAIISLYFTVFDIQLDSVMGSNRTNAWMPNSNATAVVNFTAEMEFPVMAETPVPSGVANRSYNYNATIQVPQRAPLNLTSKVPGIDSATCGTTGSGCSIAVTVDGSAVAVANYTVGSLLLKDVTSGQHTISVSYSIPATVTTTSTSPGGGGTTSAQEQTSTIFGSITPGTKNTMIINKDTIEVNKIEFVSSEPASNVKVTLKVNTPVGIPDPGTVYQWLNITYTNLNENDITSATIYFNVSKSWLSQNNLLQNEIYMKRYSSGTWILLDTTRISESSTEVYYRALSPGLSIFAITGVKTAPLPPGETGPVCGNNAREGAEQCDGTDFGSASCVTEGFDAGTLHCTNNCRLDTTDCTKSWLEPIVPKTGGEYDYTALVAIAIVLVIILGIGSWYYTSINKKRK